MAWVNAIIQGVLIGGLYALFACGLSLMFGVMKVVNLAHGDLAVVAGYVAIGIIAVIRVPVLLSFLIVVPLRHRDAHPTSPSARTPVRVRGARVQSIDRYVTVSTRDNQRLLGLQVG